MLIPHRVEVIYPVLPITNFIIIGLCSIMFIGQSGFLYELNETFVLVDWNPIGLLFSSLVHADIMHLIFNMWYLWVFGNAICAVFGNVSYVGVFFGGALVSAMTHLILDGHPAVGASGAINAIIGIFLALYPTNRIHCVYFFWIRTGGFSIKAYWLIAFWFLNDVLGLFTGSGNTAFWAHIGGVIFGLFFGVLALSSRWVTLSEFDNQSLLDVLDRIIRKS